MLVHRLRMIPRSLGWAYRFNIYITKPKDLLDLSLIHHRRVDNIHPLLAPLVISKCKRPPQQDKHWNGMARCDRMLQSFCAKENVNNEIKLLISIKRVLEVLLLQLQVSLITTTSVDYPK